MSNRDKMVIELSTEHLSGKRYYYAELTLPANEAQINDALQKARAMGREKSMMVGIINCPRLPELSDTVIDCPTIEELNFFAARLETLSPKEILMINGDFNRLKSANEFENGVTMKELINLTYGLDNITVIDCVRNDKELGRLVKEQKSEDYFQNLDEEIINMLDDEKVGMKYRDAECGYYVEDHYVARHDEIPEIYDGKTLPKDGYKAEKGEIRVAVAKIRNEKSEQTVDDTIWIKLPLDKEKIQTIKHFCEVDNIGECAVYGVYTQIPNMEFEKYSKRDCLEDFDKLAQAYENLNDGDKVKFKALAERRCPEDAESALELMNELSEYEFAYYAEDAAGFAMEYMIQRMPQGFCEDLFSENDWKSIGERLIARSDSKITEYGVISARGKGLYEEIAEENENQELGGMQM